MKTKDGIITISDDEDKSDAESSVSLVREALNESGKARERKGAFTGSLKKPTQGDLDLTQDLMNFALLSGENFSDNKDFPDLRSLLGRKVTFLEVLFNVKIMFKCLITVISYRKNDFRNFMLKIFAFLL